MAFFASVLIYSDLQFVYEGSKIQTIKITIVNYKHNSTNKPHEVVIERQRHVAFCPVQVMIEYCKIRGSQAGPLFCWANLKPITVTQFNNELRRSLNFCGLNSDRYKSHSFRIGAASYAAGQGFTDAQIRSLGRWKSDAFKLYIRPTAVTLT